MMLPRDLKRFLKQQQEIALPLHLLTIFASFLGFFLGCYGFISLREAGRIPFEKLRTVTKAEMVAIIEKDGHELLITTNKGERISYGSWYLKYDRLKNALRTNNNLMLWIDTPLYLPRSVEFLRPEELRTLYQVVANDSNSQRLENSHSQEAFSEVFYEC